MNEIEKRVALSMLAMEQERADKLAELDSRARAYAAFQSARGGLWTLASALKDETELAEALLKLASTLDNALAR